MGWRRVATPALTLYKSFQDADDPEVTVADERVSELLGVVLAHSRFELKRDMTRWDALDAFCKTLKRLGYQVSLDAEIVATKDQWLDVQQLTLVGVSFDKLVDAVLDPMDLIHRRRGSTIEIARK